MKTGKYAVVDRHRCVACGECVHVCRKGAVSILSGCWAYADRNLCVGCGLCRKSCPAGCIELASEEDGQDA